MAKHKYFKILKFFMEREKDNEKRKHLHISYSFFEYETKIGNKKGKKIQG